MKFNNVDELCFKMIHTSDVYDSVNMISNFQTAWDVFTLLVKSGYDISLVEIDGDYDREYVVSIYDHTVSLCESYDYSSNKYLGIEGIIFIDENNVNSKFVVDCRSNDFIRDFHPVYFEFGNEDDCDECSITSSINGHYMTFSIPICLERLTDKIEHLIYDYMFDDYFDI